MGKTVSNHFDRRHDGHLKHVQQGTGDHFVRGSNYVRLAGMVLVSTALGFGAMYLNTYELGHVYFSWSRLFMAMVMGGLMMAVMLPFMHHMYPNPRANRLVLFAAALLVVAGVGLVRTQTTISDVAWMKAMIPHHSIAILTSERARIADPRVRKIADGIIESQKREIAEMKALVSEMEGGG